MNKVEVTCGEKCEEDSDFTIEYTKLVRSTDKAVLVDIDGDEVWLPFSQIVYHYPRCGHLRVTKWIADEKGLNDDDA